MIDQPNKLLIEHFDTKTQQSLQINETFNNTLAGYFFPEAKFSLGTVYEQTTPEELQKITSKTLQFANGNKFYFADGSLRDLIFPIASDAAAYGSIPFTGNLSFSEVENARILVIDDETGENGIGLEPEVAKKLVGDCFCKIDTRLHSSLGGEENTAFQFRLGFKAQANDDVYRIAKGTMSPQDLSEIGSGYDLILAKSAFKGRKGTENREIEPGEHTLTVGIGIKTHAYYGEHSLGPQFLVNFPQSVRQDILPRLEARLSELYSIASDPIKIAQDYLQVTEKRYQYQIKNNTNFLELEDLSSEEAEAMLEMAAAQENQEIIYHLIKHDVHYQLLEHPKIVQVLNDHLQNQYREAATGRFVKFKGALLQPSLDLNQNEFCDPNLPDGAEVIVTRSPLVNSNGVITLTNKHLPELMHLNGVAWMHPATAAKHLQGDFDGDRVAYALARDFPTLAAEVKEKNLPQNRYADVVKKDNIPYSGSFEEIALSARTNQIGLIANQVMKTIALEMETQMLPDENKAEYLGNLSKHCQKLIGSDLAKGEALRDRFTLPPSLAKFRPQIRSIAQFSQDNRPVDEKLVDVRHLLHDIVSELGTELQIAVDGPKSALRPDRAILDCCRELTNYREVGWLKDYKTADVYRNCPLVSSNYSPIDSLVREVNRQFQQQVLEPRPSNQFRNLFGDVSFSETEKELAQEIKSEYNRLQSYAHQLKAEYQEASGPRMTLTSAKGNKLEVISLTQSNHPQTYSLSELNIRLKENKNPKRQEKYIVLAEVPGESDSRGSPQYRLIGYLSQNSETEHRLLIDRLRENKDYAELGTLKVEISPGLTAEQVRAAFAQVREYAEEVRSNIPDTDKMATAAALWDISNTRTEQVDYSYKKASAAFAIFAPEISDRLNQLQFVSFTIAGVQTASNQHGERIFTGETLPVEVGFETNPTNHNHNKRLLKVEDRVLGHFSSESAQLPVGTKAMATVLTPPGAGITATRKDGSTLRIGVLKNYDYAFSDFQRVSATLEIGFKSPPKHWQKSIPVALLDGKILGEIKDKPTLRLLKQEGLLKEGQTISVTLKRDRASIANIQIDPTTVEYPQVINQDKAYKTESRSDRLLPTLLAQEDYEWEVSPGKFVEKPTTRLVVDNRIYDKLEAYFSNLGIAISPATNHYDIQTEHQLGYDVVRIPTENLPLSVAEKLQQRFGTPLDAHWGGSYYQKLEEIDRGDYERNDLLKKAQSSKLSISPINEPSASCPHSRACPLQGVNLLPPALPEGLVKISGKPVSMVFPLHLYGEPNPLPVSTTIDAMRGYGRTHTTRTFEPYKAYGFSEGDIAIAVSGDKQLAFCVGKQYRITRQMIDDSQYRQQWKDKEKHSVKELDRFRGEPEVWGLEMKPLGDYVNGKVVPFSELQASQSQNFPSGSVREPWEKQMLTEALLCLKTSLISSDEKVKVASFKEEKYLVILDVDRDTLSIVNKHDRRELIYQAKRGEAAEIDQFSDEEKESFLSSISQLKTKKIPKIELELD
jgi:hypothetical protein